jgi:hypothetical protein
MVLYSLLLSHDLKRKKEDGYNGIGSETGPREAPPSAGRHPGIAQLSH